MINEFHFLLDPPVKLIDNSYVQLGRNIYIYKYLVSDHIIL